jgi:hypothetical protein
VISPAPRAAPLACYSATASCLTSDGILSLHSSMTVSCVASVSPSLDGSLSSSSSFVMQCKVEIRGHFLLSFHAASSRKFFPKTALVCLSSCHRIAHKKSEAHPLNVNATIRGADKIKCHDSMSPSIFDHTHAHRACSERKIVQSLPNAHCNILIRLASK